MVAPQPYAGNGQTGSPINSDPWALTDGVGVRSASFAITDQWGNKQSAPIGTQFFGTLADDLVAVQQTNFDTKAPEFWDDGRPKMNLVAVIQTNLREDENDDGKRSLYFRSQMLTALQQEMKDKKAPRFGLGTGIAVTLIDFKPTQKGSPQKIFSVQLYDIQPYIAPEQRAIEASWHVDPVAAPQQQGYAQPQQGFQPPQQQAPQPNYAPNPAAAQGFPPAQQGYSQPQAPQQAFPQTAPPQQYGNPAQAAFPGQVVPVGQPQAPQQAPQQGFAPQQQAPQQGFPQSAPPQADEAQGFNPVQQAAPGSIPLVTPEVVEMVISVMRAGIDRQTAVTSVAQKLGGGEEFAAAISAAAPQTV